TRGTPGGGAPRGPRDCRQRSAQNRASPTAVEKTLRGKVGKQTFPLRLGIPQKTRDSHFPTAATTTALRLHFKWRDDPPHGYILKWLDASAPVGQALDRDAAAAGVGAPVNSVHPPTALGAHQREASYVARAVHGYDSRFQRCARAGLLLAAELELA